MIVKLYHSRLVLVKLALTLGLLVCYFYFMDSKIKVLMADDEANITNMAGAVLKDAGYEVVTASNGLEACEKALRERPDLIILDRNMPVMDGIEACKKIRDTKGISGIPIVFLTGRDDDKEILEGLRSGAEDYIIKPFNIAEFKKRVDEILFKSGKAV